MGPTIKNGNLEVVALYAPDDAVKPGGLMKDVTLRIRMHNFTPDADEDFCQSNLTPCSPSGVGGTDGYCGVARFFTLDTQFIANPKCFNFPLPGDSQIIDVQVDIEAPATTGQQEVSGDIAMTASDEVSGQVSDTITVSEQGSDSTQTDPPPAEDEDDNGGKPPLELVLEHPIAALGLGLAATVAIKSTFDD